MVIEKKYVEENGVSFRQLPRMISKEIKEREYFQYKGLPVYYRPTRVKS